MRRAIKDGVAALGLPTDTLSLLLLPRTQSRSIALIWTTTGRGPIALAKLAHGPEGDRRIRAELSALQELQTVVPSELSSFMPTAVSLRDAAGRTVSIQTGVGERSLALSGTAGWETATATRETVVAPLAWLLRFHSWQLERTERSHRAISIRAHVEGTLERLFRQYAAVRRPVPPALRDGHWTSKGPEGVLLPQVPQHGDFAAHNVVTRMCRFSGVVDWEEYGGVLYPLYDLWSFALSMLEQLGKAPPTIGDLRTLSSAHPSDSARPAVVAWAQARDRFLAMLGLAAVEPDLLLRIQVLHFLQTNLFRLMRIDTPAVRQFYELFLERYEGWLAAFDA